MKKDGESRNDARGTIAVLADEVVRRWNSRKYRKMAQKAIKHQETVLQEIIESGGCTLGFIVVIMKK